MQYMKEHNRFLYTKLTMPQINMTKSIYCIINKGAFLSDVFSMTGILLESLIGRMFSRLYKTYMTTYRVIVTVI